MWRGGGKGIVHHCDGKRNFFSYQQRKIIACKTRQGRLGSLVASFIIFDDEMRKKRKTGVEKCPEKQIKGRRQCHDGNYNTSSSLTAKLTLNLIAIIPRFGPTTGIIGVNSDPLNAHACITGREEG